MTKNELRIVIGNKIRNERISRNMSIIELADLMEQTPGFVGLIERGQRGATAHNLLKLSHIFDLPVDAFYSNKHTETYDVAESLRKKVVAYISDFSEKELQSILLVFKGFRQLKDDD